MSDASELLAKRCPRCSKKAGHDVEHPISEFTSLRPGDYCKTCAREANAEWRAANPEKARATMREATRRHRADPANRAREALRVSALRELRRRHPDEYEQIVDEMLAAKGLARS